MSFLKTTKSLAKKLDPNGELIPVRSIVDQNSFRPLYLVQKRFKSTFFGSNHFCKTDYKLTDLLLSEEFPAKPDVQDLSLVTIVDHVDGMLEAAVDNPLRIIPAGFKASASMSCSRNVEMKKTQVGLTVLDSVIKKAKINIDHEFIKQSSQLQKDLYVITEAIETSKEIQVEDNKKIGGEFFWKACVEMLLKPTGKRMKAMTIPKSCIMAFRAKKLHLQKNGSIGISYYPEDRRGTFHTLCYPNEKKALGRTFQINEENGEVDLQMEVYRECRPLSQLATDQCGSFLTDFVAIMKDKEKNLLETLELQLEQALDNPGQFKLRPEEPELQDLVANLHYSNGALNTRLVEAILYFLCALEELTEFQLLLLAKSVEKKIVSKMLTVVTSILFDDDSQNEESVAIDIEFLAEEELNIIGAMIEMSTVTIQKIGSNLVLTDIHDALPGLNALYVALYVLHLLSK